ncbi:MAG TPA: ATP-binding cassette domain-containing protein [Streptosporangiaceae bacterium]|nr:ATP-binding cassette domain-containing protein [Streptosporangiaceae bacterium]
MSIIELKHVTRLFLVHERKGVFRRERRTVEAVRDISFSIAPGEFVGYLGANGAGKSTTIKMLTGILAPSSGEIRVCGKDPFRSRREIAYHFGAMFGQRMQLWWDLPLIDSFDQLHYIYRVPDDQYRARLAELVEILDLSSFLKVAVRQLSLGQRIRGELAAAMIHTPAILFLDEPTIGLDLVAKERVREFLTQINRRHGITIMLTTHDMADLERMCSRLIVLADGQTVSDGPLDELFGAYKLERTLTVDLSEPCESMIIPGARSVSVDGPRQVFRFVAQDLSSADLIAQVAARAKIIDLTLKEPDVEDLVRAITKAES